MVVKVKRERPDQRRHHRVTAPFYVEFAGHRTKCSDWSLGGFRIDAHPGELPAPGTEIAINATLPFQGFDVSFEAKAEVIRTDPAAGMIAARFSELGERERELMNHFVEELIRGSMSEVQDTIQRIDVPVTPASLEPTKPAGLANLPVRRMPRKAIVMSGVYGVLGLGIFGYTALLGYSNFYRMEVQTAVISAPIETVTASADGRVAWTAAKPGNPVKSGDVLLNVIDNQLEREIELADIAIKERKAQLIFLKRRQADELSRMKSYNTVETKNLEQAKIEVESVQAQMSAAEHQYGRLAILHRKGFTTDAKLEEAEKLLATLRKTLESKQVEFKSQVQVANETDGRWHYTGQNLVGELAQLARKTPGEADTRLWQDAVNRAVEAIAGLTAVDGATVLTNEYELLAFGAKIARRKGSPQVEQVTVTEPIEGNAALTVHPTQLGGTRHLSAAQFVHDQQRAVALVASQDGRFTVFAWSPCEGMVHAHRVETLLL